MKNFKPKSVPFVIITILINVILIGLVYLIISSIIDFNISYLIIGILAFIILLFEDIRILKFKLTINDEYILIDKNIFNRFLPKNNEQNQKIYFENIINYEINDGLPIIKFNLRNDAAPIFIYLKQFSKKQINQIVNVINEKINKKDKE